MAVTTSVLCENRCNQIEAKSLIFLALRHHTGIMSETESLQKVGSLAETERLQAGYNRKAFAELAGINIRTLMDFENGVRRARPLNLTKIEKVLKWRPGAIDWALDLNAERLGALTINDLRDWSLSDEPSTGVTKAEHLSDDELITELTRRFRNYAIAASGQPVTPRPVPDWRDSITTQGEVDLAAAARSKSEKLKFEHSGKVGEESQDSDTE